MSYSDYTYAQSIAGKRRQLDMKTKVLEVSLREREKAAKAIEVAAKAIAQGEVVVIPTETCYALAANATDEAAVKKIFQLKERDENKPVPVIASSLHMMQEHCKVNPVAEFLANAFMPGPLTLIVEKTSSIPDIVSREGVGFRISSNTFARAISSEAGVPITATSANKSGEPSLYNAWQVREAFSGKVPVIVLTGDLQQIPASTVVDTRCLPPKLVREGPIPWSEIQAQLATYLAKAPVAMPAICPPTSGMYEAI